MPAPGSQLSKVNGVKNFSLILLCLFFALLAIRSEAALTLEDCQKCHKLEFQQITANGMGHLSQVTCIDCHASHRPRVANNVPACQNCHEKKPHEKMTDCSRCHPGNDKCIPCHNPHQPLARTDGDTAVNHCQVCHPEAVKLMAASSSKHRDLACGFCHTLHRKIQGCRICHGTPHPEGTRKMFPQCALCHGSAHNLNPMQRR